MYFADSNPVGQKITLFVAGTSFRQEAIQAVLATVAVRPTDIVPAQLIPEPSNPHDPMAIAVKVGGNHIGYVPRRDTHIYHGLLQRNAIATILVAYIGHAIEESPYDVSINIWLKPGETI